MADVRCPMCGKFNPDSLEECQFCQARLKPLRLSSQEKDQVALPGTGSGRSSEERAGDTFDWLTNLRTSEGEEITGSAEEPLPDWLSEFRESSPPEGTGTDSDLFPDQGWLDRLGSTESSEQPSEAMDAMSWLESYQPSIPATGTTAENKPETPDELPDWLAGVEETTDSEEGAEALEWLSQLGPQADAMFGSSDQTRESSESSFVGEIPTPDWLATTPGTPAEPSTGDEDFGWLPAEPEQIPPAFEEEFTGALPEEPAEGKSPSPEEDLDWLKELESAFPETVAEPKTESPLPFSAPFTLDEETLTELAPASEGAVPDWLASVAQEAVEEAPEEEVAIERGTLPSWLEAMRPTAADGALPPELAEAPVENVGPLAGLRAVLPAEPDILQTRKPPTYSSRLQVNDIQQQRAEILAELIRTEGEPRPVPGRPVITPQHILRSLLFLVLLVAIAAPLTLGTPQIARPIAPPEVIAVGILIEKLPANAPVLVAVDFQPAAAGEMDAVAGAVLDHLMRRQVFLVLVSSSPSGVYQGEYLVQQASLLSGYPYVSGTNYVNLGFVPGGESGLQALGYAPQQILPLDFGANRVWDHPLLQNVRTAADFAMTLVLTENAETARAWIEQFRPAMGDRPLVMLVSAQVEPFVQPYLEGAAGQVQGLIAGLAGSAAYEQTWLRMGYASIYWSSYALAVYAAVLTIVLAGLMNLALVLIKRRQQSSGGGGN